MVKAFHLHICGKEVDISRYAHVQRIVSVDIYLQSSYIKELLNLPVVPLAFQMHRSVLGPWTKIEGALADQRSQTEAARGFFVNPTLAAYPLAGAVS